MGEGSVVSTRNNKQKRRANKAKAKIKFRYVFNDGTILTDDGSGAGRTVAQMRVQDSVGLIYHVEKVEAK